jgi:hypothetical protein
VKLFVEILPDGGRRSSFGHYKPWYMKLGRVLRTEPKDWATTGYWKVLVIEGDLDRFSDWTEVPK